MLFGFGMLESDKSEHLMNATYFIFLIAHENPPILDRLLLFHVLDSETSFRQFPRYLVVTRFIMPVILKYLSIAMVLLFCGAHSAAANVTIYSFEKVPDVDSIVMKDGHMYAAFRGATVSDALNTFNKLLKLDMNGKTKCVKMEHVELGMGWTEKPCLTVRRADQGTYEIDVVDKFDYASGIDDFLKENDFVKERRFTLHFSADGNGCEVSVTKRTYIPVGGTKQKPSRTGAGVCRVEHH
jgi:hypothetical protein